MIAMKIFMLLVLVSLVMGSPRKKANCKYKCDDCDYYYPDGCRACRECREMKSGKS